MAENPATPVGSEDGLVKAIELVATPVVFAAAGFGLDRWWGTGPWLALSFGMVAFLVKLAVEWYRYAERMRIHEQDLSATRPTRARGLDRPADTEAQATLPVGVSLKDSEEDPQEQPEQNPEQDPESDSRP